MSARALTLVVLAPFAVTFLFVFFLGLPATRDGATEQLMENSPVELLTALVAFVAGIVAFSVMRICRRGAAPGHAVAFFGVFAVALVLVAMEEIAWGQWLFGFDTPTGLEEINEQDEVTIHNVKGFHGKTEFLRLTFGIGGLVGIALRSNPWFRGLTPPLFLTAWFALIVFLVIPDLLNDFIDIGDSVAALFDYLSELNELIVAVSAFTFLWFARRYWQEDAAASTSVEL